MSEHPPSISRKTFAAILYVCSSISLIIFNKILFTGYQFHDQFFLIISQMLSTIIGLSIFSKLGYLTLPILELSKIRQIILLPLSFIFMLVFSWAGMAVTSLAIFTALRRLTMLFVLVLELIFLGSKPAMNILFSVGLCVLGVLIAGWSDLSFDLAGYIFAFLANFFTACNVVLIKYNKNSLQLDEWGLLFYNTSIALPLAFPFLFIKGEGTQFFSLIFDDNGLLVYGFILAFISSSLLGLVINYSIYLNTSVNSPLHTSVLGQTKDAFILLISVFYFQDFQYHYSYIIGIFISSLGALLYIIFNYRNSNIKPIDSELKHLY